jgi:hypothetical protein
MGLQTPVRCILLFTPLLASGQTGEPSRPEAGIGIRIVRGDGAINSIRMARGHNPIAQVVNQRTGDPVEGATVTFLLPATGPGASFRGSGPTLTILSGADGLAEARGLTPNRLSGEFRIRVAASWRGQTASTNLTQTNVDPIVSSGKGKKIAILAAVAGGVAGGVLAASRRGSGTPGLTAGGAVAGPGPSIVPGAPSIGPP